MIPTYDIHLLPGESVLITADAPPPPPIELVNMQVLKGHGEPVDGVTGVGIADRGVWYLDLDTGSQYSNIGTIASPEWHGVITT